MKLGLGGQLLIEHMHRLDEIQVHSTNTMVTTDSTFHQHNSTFHPQKSPALRLQLVYPENVPSSIHVVEEEEQNELHCHGN